MRIIGDSRENERRINEEVNRQGRRQKLLYEAESSARQNAAVAMKWSALFDKEIPQELLAEIELQRDACERIIQSKDRLIKEFKVSARMRRSARRLASHARAGALTRPHCPSPPPRPSSRPRTTSTSSRSSGRATTSSFCSSG